MFIKMFLFIKMTTFKIYDNIIDTVLSEIPPVPTNTGSNTKDGEESLINISTGIHNTGYGYKAGDSITTGTNNILIGSGSDASAANGNNQIVIGKDAVGGGNNSAVIGNNDCVSILPSTNDKTSLGSDNVRFKDVFVSNSVEIGGNTNDTLLIRSSIPGEQAATHSAFYVGLEGPTSEDGRYVYIGNHANTNGNQNIYIGYNAGKLTSIQEGSTARDNVHIGTLTGSNMGEGDLNTLIGSYAGGALTIGNKNTVIGSQANVSGGSAQNQIVIGFDAVGTGNNEISLGNTLITAIKSQVTSITSYSDVRIKNVVATPNPGDTNYLGLAFINRLKPTRYTMKHPADYPTGLLPRSYYKNETKDGKPCIRRLSDEELTIKKETEPFDVAVYLGLLADDVQTALTSEGVEWDGLVTEPFEIPKTIDNQELETLDGTGKSLNVGSSKLPHGGKKAIKYASLIMPLVNAIKELSEASSLANNRLTMLELNHNLLRDRVLALGG